MHNNIHSHSLPSASNSERLSRKRSLIRSHMIIYNLPHDISDASHYHASFAAASWTILFSGRSHERTMSYFRLDDINHIAWCVCVCVFFLDLIAPDFFPNGSWFRFFEW